MVTTGECLVAMFTLEGFCTRVFPVMPRQFVTTCKLPRASLPRAFVGFLSRVSAHVCLQMRALRVHLPATGVLALVYTAGRLRSTAATRSVPVIKRHGVAAWRIGVWGEVIWMVAW